MANENLYVRLEKIQDWLRATKAFALDEARDEFIKTIEEAQTYVTRVFIGDNRNDETEITDCEAIKQLQGSGWLQSHDETLTIDSAAAIINRIMFDGNKTISINIYPFKGGDENG